MDVVPPQLPGQQPRDDLVRLIEGIIWAAVAYVVIMWCVRAWWRWQFDRHVGRRYATNPEVVRAWCAHVRAVKRTCPRRGPAWLRWSLILTAVFAILVHAGLPAIVVIIATIVAWGRRFPSDAQLAEITRLARS
jgi:hypothetical protein